MIKLWSKDGKILNVDMDVIKHMVIIQTMLDCPGVEDNNDDDEPIPIFTINGEVIEKLVCWTRYHLENNNNYLDYKVWCHQFFMENLKDIFVLEDAAKYLDLRSYLDTTEVIMDKNFQLLTNNKLFLKTISRDRLGDLLARDTLDVPSEQVVLESLNSWISSDPEERSKSLQELIPHIRANFLFHSVIEENLKTMQENPSYHQLNLNYDNKIPRYGYELCIVALHETNDSRYLKYLDLKVKHSLLLFSKHITLTLHVLD